MSEIAADDLISVSILTGFLGSGKTTLLSHLLKKPELSDTAVVINEFGEIGLDHHLLESSEENIVQLDSGCLCCTVRGDLLDTMRDLHDRREKGEIPHFRRVVIETTGLADPAPIIHTLLNDPTLLDRFKLDGVITVIDAVNGASTLDRHQEAVKQAAVADRLLLTKSDVAEATITLKDRLRHLNPAAPLIQVVNGEADPNELFNTGFYNPETKTADVAAWLKEEAYRDQEAIEAVGHHHHHDHDHDHHDHDHHDHHGHDHHGHHDHHHDVNRHDDHIQAYCITRDKPISALAINSLMQILFEHRGEDLLRVKGILNVTEQPGKPAVIHAVQHLMHPVAWLEEWPDDDHRSRIVFITRDISRDWIEALIDGLNEEAEEVKAEEAEKMAKAKGDEGA
jgi:G3E family GTPase